ncbi:MAG: hypothetical protein M2R45_03168 [Verrucomicrobia subdivision 3 bacterium]|nr:hypothetical protein [Limisphaerales bacterium]MCS1413235.1 hypothetical protein [Limisphaerales bacterium]
MPTLDREQISPALSELVQRSEEFGHQSRRMIFNSTGWALEDQIAMDIILDHSAAMGSREYPQIKNFSPDPHSLSFARQPTP